MTEIEYVLVPREPTPETLAAAERDVLVAERVPDLSDLLRHAFLAGRGLTDGDMLSAVDRAAWAAYDPAGCPALSRILSALEPAPPSPVVGEKPAGHVSVSYLALDHPMSSGVIARERSDVWLVPVYASPISPASLAAVTAERDALRAESERLREAATDLCDAWENNAGKFRGNVTRSTAALRAVLTARAATCQK